MQYRSRRYSVFKLHFSERTGFPKKLHTRKPLYLCSRMRVAEGSLKEEAIKKERNIYQKSMQIRCSKKGCKKREKGSKMEPKWEPKSRTSQAKTRSENSCEKRAACLAVRPHVAGAFLRLNNLFSSRPRLVFVPFSCSKKQPKSTQNDQNETPK